MLKQPKPIPDLISLFTKLNWFSPKGLSVDFLTDTVVVSLPGAWYWNPTQKIGSFSFLEGTYFLIEWKHQRPASHIRWPDARWGLQESVSPGPWLCCFLHQLYALQAVSAWWKGHRELRPHLTPQGRAPASHLPCFCHICVPKYITWPEACCPLVKLGSSAYLWNPIMGSSHKSWKVALWQKLTPCYLERGKARRAGKWSIRRLLRNFK